ncbi:MAG: hypothetical protein ISQ32_05550 [Rickettsiales bacterium]|nr:hypothetical protein [Rickettsiales bacterium]
MCEIFELCQCCCEGGCENCGELLFGVASLPFNIVYGVGSGVCEIGSGLLNTASVCCNVVSEDVCLASIQVCEMTSDCVSFLDFKNCCPKFSYFPRSKERYNLPSDQRANSQLPLDIVVATQPRQDDYETTIAEVSKSNEGKTGEYLLITSDRENKDTNSLDVISVKNNNDPHSLDDINLGFVLEILEANARRNVCDGVPNISL